MTLSLLKSPPKVSLVGNDILFKINTDNQYSIAGSSAELVFKFNGKDTTPGNKFKLEFLNNELEFELATTPDGSGTQLPIAAAGEFLSMWVDNMAKYMGYNYLLSLHYEIERTTLLPDEFIYITAKEKGTDYSIIFTNDPVNPVQNLHEHSNTPGVSPVVRDFYQLLAKIWLKGTSENTLLGEDRLTPDDEGDVRFTIQEYFKPELISEFAYPENNEVRIIKRTDFIKQFFIEYAETYDNISKRLYSTEGILTYAMQGKINQQKVNILNDLDMSFWDEIIASQMFLTWHPLEKTISAWQPEKLYYLSFTRASVLYVKAKSGDGGVGGNEGGFEFTIGSIACDQYDVIEICCGHDILGLQYLTGLVSPYEVWVENDSGEIISEIRTYIVDDQYRENEYVFLFKNSLGAYETLRTTGIQAKSNKYEHTLIEMIKVEGDSSYSEESSMESWMEETFKANSGWITKEELDWTNDFVLSVDRYIIENWKLFSVLVTSTKIFQHKDNEYLYMIEFEYKKSAKASAYNNVHSINPWLEETGIPILTENEELILI